ncbi:hypothetical protein [Streptomyces sp. H27-H5]|uniref:hypothetical protein n=1 Tax=Streptomyces sp. H27-H5 TaxID=2996460 RepID=UPI00226F1152|nr:hypothetical protein [Streptomyces sp. H27-H5]MCY0963237.1 hypothetical protein [Streptomyces sp. H27-H5]
MTRRPVCWPWRRSSAYQWATAWWPCASATSTRARTWESGAGFSHASAISWASGHSLISR